MDCKVKWACCLGLMILSIAGHVDGNCTLIRTTDSPCEYTVACESHPGHADNPFCEQTPNVTFTITNSHLCTGCTLTAGFFSTTNFDSRVRQFIVKDSYWPTIESSAFRYYAKTVYIDLSSIGIGNLNDGAFTNLIHLKFLNLSNNEIQKITTNTFNFATGTSMQTLDLSNNRIASLQNDVFSRMPILLELNLQGNAITHIDNDAFSNIHFLSILYLQHNKLPSINLTVAALRALKHLDLSYNLITVLKDYETNSLRSLEYLNISNNALEFVEGNCFVQALNLQFLDFSNNNIHSTIENYMFKSNTNLKYLNFYNNKITTIKDNSFAFSTIEYINFERNNLTGNISLDSLKGLSNITSLNIVQQNINIIEDRAFSGMVHLKSLNLSRNCIKKVENSSFEFDAENSLTVLDMSHNYLRSVYFLQNFTGKLIELYLSFNELTILEKNIFANHKDLQLLDISCNMITIIEPYSLPLHNLQYLNISDNRLRGNITANIYSPAKFIRYLNLSHSHYRHINENAFLNLPLLTKLNLSHNELEFINADNFKGLENMFSLDLSFNNFTKLELNNKLNNLQAVYLNNNKFTQLPRIFSNVSNILHVDLSHNNISDMNNVGFENVTSLRILDLSHNKILNFNNKLCNELTKLTFLAISYNQISEIKLSFFKELTYVDLSNNMIKFINSSTFEGLNSLQYLDLSRNKISEVLPGTFQHQNSLKLLNLSSNYLTHLRYGSFRGLNNTDMLDLSKNQLTALDIYIFHECIELRILFIDYNFIKNVDVDRLTTVTKNLSILSIGGNPMSCEEIVRTLQNKNSSLSVTAIHKIFHDDNVHGIKCGTGEYTQPKTESDMIKHVDNDKVVNGEGDSTSNIILIWCSVLTVIFAVSAGVICYRKFYKIKSRAQLRNSVNIGSIQYDRDLLS